MAEFDEKLNAILSNPQAMEQIMQLAQSLSPPQGEAAQTGAATAAAETAPPPPAPAAGTPLPVALGGLGGVLSGLGDIDPRSLTALLPILRELGSGQNSQARQLLLAMRPYLKPERQDKVERALQFARLFRVGKRFLLKGDRHV